MRARRPGLTARSSRRSAGSEHWGADAPAVFATITIPTLSLGGELTQSAGLAPFLQAMFGVLPAGPSVIGYGVLHEAGHGTFSDICETPDALLQALNGSRVPECEPESLPWRYARHIIDYVALNFFDGVLNGNAEALARVAPAVLADIEELTYQSK